MVPRSEGDPRDAARCGGLGLSAIMYEFRREAMLRMVSTRSRNAESKVMAGAFALVAIQVTSVLVGAPTGSRAASTYRSPSERAAPPP